MYIDAFAGPGVHISRQTGDFVQGSPRKALEINPPFRQFFFIDIEREKASLLKELVGERSDVRVLQGDCNEVLLAEVFPHVQYSDFRRGLLLLDPYGLHLNGTYTLDSRA